MTTEKKMCMAFVSYEKTIGLQWEGDCTRKAVWSVGVDELCTQHSQIMRKRFPDKEVKLLVKTDV